MIFLRFWSECFTEGEVGIVWCLTVGLLNSYKTLEISILIFNITVTQD